MEKEKNLLTPSQNESEKLFERKQIEDTPFAAVGNETTGYMLVCGKYRVSEKTFNSMEAAEKDARKIDWNKICNVIGITIELLNEKK